MVGATGGSTGATMVVSVVVGGVVETMLAFEQESKPTIAKNKNAKKEIEIIKFDCFMIDLIVCVFVLIACFNKKAIVGM